MMPGGGGFSVAVWLFLQVSGVRAHAAGVERLLASYRTIPATASVRLAKRTSNLFRARVRNDGSRAGHVGVDRGDLGRSGREDR